MSCPYITMVVVESEDQNLTLTTDGKYKNDQEAIDHLVDNLEFMLQCLRTPGTVTGELTSGKRLFIRHQVMTEDVQSSADADVENFPIEEAILA